MTLTPIDAILEEVTVAAQLETTARGIVFSVVIEPELSVQVDRQMLSSAIANLLQNAFKFTRSGGRISLTARVVAKGPRMDNVIRHGAINRASLRPARW